MEIVSGDEQRTMLDTSFPEPLVVALRDGEGNTYADKTIAFSVQEGTAAFDAGIAEKETNHSGEASITVLAGSEMGNVPITAELINEKQKYIVLFEVKQH